MRRGGGRSLSRCGNGVGQVRAENFKHMSKGKDFRPRKRGFDDDGPMPYEPRPRSPRGFGGQPEGGFGGAPAFGSAAPSAAMA